MVAGAQATLNPYSIPLSRRLVDWLALLIWLLLGLLWGLLQRPYQALSELGFRLQRLDSSPLQPSSASGALLVFGASVLVSTAMGVASLQVSRSKP